MLVSRILDNRKNSSCVGATANAQRTQELRLSMDSLTSAMESLEAAMLGAMQKLHQTRRVVERMDRQVSGLPLPEHDAS